MIPRDARYHGYLALKVDGGRRGFGRGGRWFGGSGRDVGGCRGFGGCGGGARGDGELLGRVVRGRGLVLRLASGFVLVHRGRRALDGLLLLAELVVRGWVLVWGGGRLVFGRPGGLGGLRGGRGLEGLGGLGSGGLGTGGDGGGGTAHFAQGLGGGSIGGPLPRALGLGGGARGA